MATDTYQRGITKTGDKFLEGWKDAIRLGRRYRRIYGRSRDWANYKNFYRGYFGKRVVPVNIIFAIGRSIIPQVYFRNPRVSVIARKPGYALHARVLERIDNWLIQELGIKEQLKSEILDSYLTGRGVGILGYDSEFGYSQEFASPQIIGDGSLSSFAEGGEKIEYNVNIKPGMPWYQRCNPMDFIVPWGTHKWDEAPWFAFRKMRRLQDILEDRKYPEKAKLDLEGHFKSRLESSEEDSSRLLEDSASDWVEIWQCHDQRTGLVYNFSLDHDKFLRVDNDYLQLEGLPGRAIGFNEDPDFFWWPSDCRQIVHQQLELNDIRTSARMHRRVAILKVLAERGVLKPEEIEKFFDGDPKVMVQADIGAGGDVRKSVALFQSHVPPDLTIASREVREDIREIIGFSRNQMGSFEDSSGRRTAHEAEIVRAASMIRIDERRDVMADHLSSVVRGINQIIFNAWDAERIVDIVGNDGARYWVRFTGRELKGEFDFKINPEETIPSDKRTQQTEILNFMQLVAKVPGANMQYLMETYADKFDWLDASLLFPGSGAGRSPEKALDFNQFLALNSSGASRYPSLGQALTLGAS